MAHKRLRGKKRPKMGSVRKPLKNAKKDAKKTKGKSDNQGTAPKAASVVAASTGGLSKKEAKMQALLVKQHQALYAPGERILLVGEGNFSFARALCKQLGSGAGVYATCLDSDATLTQKYPDAAECRKEIEESYGGTCLTGVDATRLHKVKEFRDAFKKIVFNFPHLGTGEKDVEKIIALHRKFLAAFFVSAAKCLDPRQHSSIHVALKTSEPYKSFKIVQIVRAACPELDLSTVAPFMPAAWDGYAHRRTIGFSEKYSKADSEELAKGAKVYVFGRSRTAVEDEDEDGSDE
jgi:25S rRNA (uracil2634-N3)-methyltransferase